MRQFRTILSFELKNYFKNKVFVGSTLFIVAVLAVVMFLPNLIGFFGSMGGDSSDEPTEQSVILVSAPSQEMGETIAQALASAFPDQTVTWTQDDLAKIKEQVSNQEADCALVFDSLTSYTYYVYNRSLYDQTTQVANQVLVSLAQVEAMTQQGLSPDQAGEILSLQIDAKEELLGVDQAQNYWYTYIMTLALYMVIMLYGQMVASHVATEKSSRAMELLITSATPVNMMFGKVLASCIAGFVQLAVIFGSALLFYQLNLDAWGGNSVMTSLFDMPLCLPLRRHRLHCHQAGGYQHLHHASVHALCHCLLRGHVQHGQRCGGQHRHDGVLVRPLHLPHRHVCPHRYEHRPRLSDRPVHRHSGGVCGGYRGAVRQDLPSGRTPLRHSAQNWRHPQSSLAGLTFQSLPG